MFKIKLRKEEMKLFKKLSALLLVLVLLVTLTACGSPTPEPVDPETLAFETYSLIMEQLSVGPGSESGAFDVDMVMEMEMSMMGETITIVSTSNMVMIVDGDHIQTFMLSETDMGEIAGFHLGTMVMEMHMELEGETLIDMRILIDGAEMPAELFPQEELQAIFDASLNMPDMDANMFTSVELEEMEDGNTYIHVILDGTMLTEFTASIMDGMLSDLMMGMELDFEIEDVYMTMVIDADGNPLSQTMDMQMRMELEGEVATMRMVSTSIFNAFGADVQILV